MNYVDYKDIKLSRLGLGCMRFPLRNPGTTDPAIDYEAAHRIIDHAMEMGINYYDTAHVYNGGDSEACLGACMEKHDRDSYYVATKYNIDACKDYKQMFEDQLARLKTDRIDFFLIHCLTDGNIEKYLESGAIEYFAEQKALGRITYLGFSSHASVQSLTRFADLREWDFCQIQLNYYDWLYGSAEKEYEVLANRGIPVTVMEPVRGGRLAELTPGAEALLKKAHPDWSIAAWALRFVASLPAVRVVLSGMSNLEQLEDNLGTFSDDTEFTEEDRKILFEAAAMFRTQIQVPCTGCSYCTANCPMSINIPEYLKVYNQFKVNGSWGIKERAAEVNSEGTPFDCIGCGACMGHCPQSIQIPDAMHALADVIK